MEKCAEERKAWQQALAEVDRLRKALKAENGRIFSSVNTPATWEKVAKIETDLADAEERLRTTERAYEDCRARNG